MVAAIVVFSSSSTLVKWSHGPGPVIALGRMIGACVLWWAAILVRRAVTGHPLPPRATWRAVTPAALCFGANISVFFLAIGHTSITHAEFITSLGPLLMVPIGALAFGERLNWRAAPFALFSLGGLAIVLFAGPATSTASLGGDLLILSSLASWAAYLTFGRRTRQHVEVVDFMATLMPLGLIVVAPVALLLERDAIWPLDHRQWTAIVALSVLNGTLGHGLVAVAQRRLHVGTMSVIQVAQPALAVCWAAIVLGEAISPAQIPGMAMVLVGLAGFTLLQQRRPRRVTAPPAPAPAEIVCPVAGD